MAAIGGLRSDLSITRKTDGNFVNVSAGVLFSKIAYENGGKCIFPRKKKKKKLNMRELKFRNSLRLDNKNKLTRSFVFRMSLLN